MEGEKSNRSVVYYDAVCVMCDSFIQYLIKIDKDHILRFASLQSDLWTEAKKEFDKKWPENGTVVFRHEGKWFTESDAVLKIFEVVGKFRVLVWILFRIPRLVRNPIYRWIAGNRYRLFGKKTSCTLLPAEKRYLFLDDPEH